MKEYPEGLEDDLYYLLEPLIKQGVLVPLEDGSFLIGTEFPSLDYPWDVYKPTGGCFFAFQVLFKCVSQQVYKKHHIPMVPTMCQGCWKVVVRPKTLEELHEVRNIQKVMDRPSKCGIERRPFTSRLYGGYWYNKSLSEGLECFKLVKREVGNMPILLKRGCTEIELQFGDSRKWAEFKGQRVFEDMIREAVIATGDEDQPQVEDFKKTVHRHWIRFAYKHGDETYLKFSEPLYPQYTTYDHLEGKTEGHIKDFFLKG